MYFWTPVCICDLCWFDRLSSGFNKNIFYLYSSCWCHECMNYSFVSQWGQASLCHALCNSFIQTAGEIRGTCHRIFPLILHTVCSFAADDILHKWTNEMQVLTSQTTEILLQTVYSITAASCILRHTRLQMFHHSCKRNMATGTKSFKRAILHLIHGYFVIAIQTWLKRLHSLTTSGSHMVLYTCRLKWRNKQCNRVVVCQEQKCQLDKHQT